MDKTIRVNKGCFQDLNTKIRHLVGELATYKDLVDFVRRFNPRVFYRTPKDLIDIICEFKEEITGKSCKK